MCFFVHQGTASDCHGKKNTIKSYKIKIHRDKCDNFSCFNNFSHGESFLSRKSDSRLNRLIYCL